ncbi:MAG: hypothetical protein HY775_03790 [Acidobacteria bacterium]|nr:hypothetical protein [Acidobacteriota bacterium]
MSGFGQGRGHSGRGRRVLLAAGAAAALALGVGPVPGATARIETQLVADGAGVAFALRPAVDFGGASPMPLYIGYADANLTTPSPAADGQASWYNLNIVESSAFRPAENCTPEKNAEATQAGVADVQAWLAGYIATATSSLQAQQQPPPPTAPGPRHACAERFPGFAQSRYPATQNIAESSSDNLLDKHSAAWACREDPASQQCSSYKQYWPAFRAATGAVVRDGSFFAESTSDPSQRSEALLFGAGDGAVVSVGLARTSASAHLEGTTLVAESVSVLDDVCVVASGAGCTLRIGHLRGFARVTKPAGGKPVVERALALAGVSGAGVARDVTAEDLQLGAVDLDLGGYLKIQAVSAIHTCDLAETDPGTGLADAGGLLLWGSGGAGQQGGAITIGGACARARASVDQFEVPDFSVPPASLGTPPRTIVIPGLVPPPLPAGPVQPVLGPARVVTKNVVRVEFRRAVAWRTAPYWGSMFGALALLSLAGYRFRRTPAVAPVAGALGRVTRQFLRG